VTNDTNALVLQVTGRLSQIIAVGIFVLLVKAYLWILPYLITIFFTRLTSLFFIRQIF